MTFHNTAEGSSANEPNQTSASAGESAKRNKRATFVEGFNSIKRFKRKTVEQPNGHWPQPGFAVSKSTHCGEASFDDYKQAVLSSN